MNGFLALLQRDLRLAWRGGADQMTLVLFFVLVGIVVPFAIGPDVQLLSRLSPAIVWIAAFLSSLLGLDRLFRDDYEDGSLVLMRHAEAPLEVLVLARLFGHWLLTGLPLLVATPVLALLLSMDMPTFLATLLALALGTPALAALSTIGAAITVPLRRGGLVGPVVILPLAIPVLIFGTSAIAPFTAPGTASASLLLLAALSLFLIVIAPFAAALALRAAEE